jgi:glyoxylate reductase
MGSWEVLVTRRIPEAGLELIRRECAVQLWEEDRPMPKERLLALAAGKDGIVCLLSDPMGADVMAAAGPKLRAIAIMAVGYDNIDLAEATRRGIVVGNTPGVLTEATADLTWALILSLGRRIVEGDRLVRSGGWTGWGPTQLVGADYTGQTLGIVGLGRIGKAVARRGRGFGMKVIYHNRKRLPEREEAALPARYAGMDELIAESDFISLHCPLNRESHHLLSRERIARMKPTAYLVNVARGPVVDEAALVEALQEGRIAGAALDVYEQEPRLTPGLTKLFGRDPEPNGEDDGAEPAGGAEGGSAALVRESGGDPPIKKRGRVREKTRQSTKEWNYHLLVLADYDILRVD